MTTLSDTMSTPEFRDDEIVVPVAIEAFICTRCGTEKEDKTSTFSFFKGEVLCNDCLTNARN